MYLSIIHDLRLIARNRNREHWIAVELHILQSLVNQLVNDGVLILVPGLIISL